MMAKKRNEIKDVDAEHGSHKVAIGGASGVGQAYGADGRLETVIDRVMAEVESDEERSDGFKREIRNLSAVKKTLLRKFRMEKEAFHARQLYALAGDHEERVRVLESLYGIVRCDDFFDELADELQGKSWFDEDEYLECMDEVIGFWGRSSVFMYERVA